MRSPVLAVFVSAGLTVGVMDVLIAWALPGHLDLGVTDGLLLGPVVLLLLGLTGAVIGGLVAGLALMVGGRIRRRLMPRLSVYPRRWVVLGLIGAAACVGSLAMVIPAAGTVCRLALLGIALFAGAMPGAALWARVDPTERAIPRSAAVALGAVGMLGLLSFSASPQLRLQTQRRTAAARTVLDAWAGLTDLDGDGYPGLIFGPDCRPFDSGIHPAAADLPGNGVDEDCAGGDHRPDVNPRAAEVRGGGSLSGRSLIVVTVAGLRSDRTGGGGSERMVTPGLDLLATRAAVMPRAYAAAPTGPAALYGLMTGRRPARAKFEPAWLGLDDHITTDGGTGDRRLPDLPVSDKAPTLAELLRTAGYQTIAVTCCAWQRRGGGLLRGFDVVDDLAFQTRNRGGDGVVADVLARQAARQAIRSKGRRYLLWVHLPDARAPYLFHAGTPYFGESPADRRDGELAFTDAQLASFLDEIERAGVTDNALVVVAGGSAGDDPSGDQRGSADSRGTGLRESAVRAPLYIWRPDAPRRHIPAPVRHVDLLPTLLQLLAVEGPGPAAPLDGLSLLPLLTADADSPVAAAVAGREAISEERSGGRDLRGLVSGGWKLVEDKRRGTVELFHLSVDPNERKNLASAMPERTATLRRRLADLTTATP